MQNFEIIITMYSNSERSEQYLKQDAFLTYSGMFLRSRKLEQFRIQIGKNYWELQKHAGKVRKYIFLNLGDRHLAFIFPDHKCCHNCYPYNH